MRAQVALAFLGLASVSVFCRYTIRDIGFVNLKPDEYVLTRVVSGDSREAVLSKDLSVLGAVLCQDTNLRLTGLNALRTQDGQWLERLEEAGRDAAWFLTGVDLPPLLLPAFAAGGPEDEVRAAVEWAVDSPLRGEWSQQALSTFASLWIFEGEDPQANATALAEVEAAVDALKRLAPSLPRPLQHPARVRCISIDEQEGTPVSLWSMGLSDPQRRPAVAVIYGRGKRAGDVLVGASIQETELVTQLALVGSSCECDTDRQWLSEPSLPLRWTPSLQRLAADSLGFDPESPLVVAEVQRILAQVQSGHRGAGSAGGVAALLLGYNESSLVEGPGSAPALEPNADEPSGAPDSLRPVAGDDWAFEDPPSEPKASGMSWASNLRFSVIVALLLFLAVIAGVCIWIYTRRHG
ncbi:MAG: hypothetical protein QF848_15120 [Planctomycetota bacterium]|jgi:hypothetical protein|nr:hypothetical protein [Planctomycetota bacterium]